MNRRNQPEQRQSSIFIITILAGTVLGVVLLGLISAFFVTDAPVSKYSFSVPFAPEEQSEPKLKSTYFLDHYVGYSKKYARLPNHFCKTYTNSESTKATNIYSYSCLAQGVEFSEIDLTEHVLPVDKITSAVINTIYIAYMTEEDGSHDECDYKVYRYNTYEKTTQEINVPKEIIVCGAIGTNIESISPSGRYIRFEASGPASAYGSWIYDTKLNNIDKESKHSRYHYFFPAISPENGGEKDEIMIYQGDCETEKLNDINNCPDRGIYVKNKTTGKSLELKQFNTQEAHVCMASIAGFQRDYYDDTLRVWGDCLGFEVVIENFSKMIAPLAIEDEQVIPKIEQYTDEKAYGTIKKLYQKNGTWYVDVDIAEFYPFGAREKPAMEDGVQLSGVDLVYIRDNSDEVVTFELAENIQINLTQIIKDNKVMGVNELHSSNLEELEIAIQQGEFHFILEDGVVTEINEQFFS